MSLPISRGEGDPMTDKVFDFQAKLKDSIEKKKRAFERVALKDFLGAYSEIDEHGTKYPVKMLDISYDGCQFQIPFSEGAKKHFAVGSEITLRLYFTSEDFLPINATLRHETVTDERGNSYMRFGCEFDQSNHSYQAIRPFIEFLYKFAEHSCQDRGEHKVYFI